MEELGFMAKDNGRWRFPVNFPKHSTFLLTDESNVLVLRAILFFHAEEKTTLKEIRKFFTETAITTFEHDGYIKIER